MDDETAAERLGVGARAVGWGFLNIFLRMVLASSSEDMA